LSIPSGTVRSRLHIARQRLKELLSEHEEAKPLVKSKEVAA
ncbi:MAG: RNA polymerase subunit sigma-24, partial [Anaerolineaceae bacterium]|nr:RNA polymerase subunit sigma-24 [Anaerolineaceae bacterium]